jgi:hypothetical protein
VEAAGTWVFDGIFRADSVTVPQGWVWDAKFRIIPSEASCASVWGDLFDPTLLGESGAIVTMTAQYLALPSGTGTDEVDLGDVVAHVQEAGETLLAGGMPSSAEILGLVRAVQAATGEIVRAHLCDDIDEEGATVAHAWFEELLQDLLFAVFRTLEGQGDAYTTGELIELLNAGVSVGAVGASTVNQVAAEALLDQFRFWLDVRADEAYASRSRDELIAIAVTAEQYGWQDLQNKSYSFIYELDET